jgi:outer membrane lipoprotein SlyB
MKTTQHLGTLVALAAALTLAACANPPATTNGSTYPSYGNTNNNVYPRYGVVQSIDLVHVNTNGIGGSSVGVGTIAGAVVGGIVGNQVGSGSGKTAATVIGAAGGAYAGHALEKNAQQTTDAFKFTVLMEDRTYQTVTQTANGDIRVGDRVQIDNGVVRRN